MMKWVLLSLTFIVPHSFAGEPLDYSCEASKGHQTFLVATKKNRNVIHLGLKMNQSTCTIKNEKDIMNLYWKVGEKVSNGVIPCQAISNMEKKFFSLEESDIKRLSPNLALITYKDLKIQGTKFGHDLSEEIEVEVLKGRDGKCVTKTKIIADSRPLFIDRIHNNISFFSLKGVDFYYDNEKVLVLR